MRQIILIAHDIRSTHNVGSLFRTAEGLGVAKLFLTGYTPYPISPEDERLPHLAARIDRQIAKTALGAERSLRWEQTDELVPLIKKLRAEGFTAIGIEQAAGSMALPDYRPPGKVALIVGNEVTGIEPALLAELDKIVEIPMYGRKESFNVVQAAAMTLYHCRFAPE